MNDKIVKKTTLRAPVAKVWRAISDSAAFGVWFGLVAEGPFVEGRTVRCTIAKTQMNDEIAEHQAPYVGVPFELRIERVVPEKLLAFRWQPGVDSSVSPDEPMTLVTFELEAVAEGTLLVVTESGFDALSIERRAKAFAENEGGWEAQLGLVAAYVERVHSPS